MSKEIENPWRDIDPQESYSVFKGNAHPITRKIRQLEEEEILNLISNCNRVIWLGIGMGDITKGIIDKSSKKIDLVAVEVNNKIAEFAKYTLSKCYDNIGDYEVVSKDIKDFEYEPKEKDLVILDFGTYGNLSEDNRSKVFQMIKKCIEKGGTGFFTTFDPEYKDQHMKRYRWDVSHGIAASIKEVKEKEGEIKFIFDRGGSEIFSFHPYPSYMLKRMKQAGISDDYVKLIDSNPLVNLFVVSKNNSL